MKKLPLIALTAVFLNAGCRNEYREPRKEPKSWQDTPVEAVHRMNKVQQRLEDGKLCLENVRTGRLGGGNVNIHQGLADLLDPDQISRQRAQNGQNPAADIEGDDPGAPAKLLAATPLYEAGENCLNLQEARLLVRQLPRLN